jgi:hypothetical protein
MPSVAISQTDKQYLEGLRRDRDISAARVPTVKETMALVLKFVRNNRREFREWVKGKKSGKFKGRK